MLAKAGSRPVIWDSREPFEILLREREWIPAPLRPVAAWLWDRQERRHVRRCAAVITVTEPIAKRYRTMHERVVVLANFPRVESLPAPSTARDGKTCVYAGTINPLRNIETILRAFSLLRSRGLDVPLALAGRPASQEYLAEILAEAEQLGVRDLVTYHGILSHRDTLRLENEASISLVVHLPFPSALIGMPVKMVECMAMGVPLVLSNIPINHEVAGAAAIAADPTSAESIADAVECLVRDPDLAQRMGEAGMQAVRERLCWEVEQEKLLQLYAELVGVPSEPLGCRNGDRL
jgi:glycosyltransferase involved in cell wall biosynthesis